MKHYLTYNGRFYNVAAVAVLLLLLVMLSACHVGRSRICGKMSGKTDSEMTKIFFESEKEVKFDLYLCGMRSHPPKINYAYNLVEAEGNDVLTLLSNEILDSARCEVDKCNILFVFDIISQRKLLILDESEFFEISNNLRIALENINIDCPLLEDLDETKWDKERWLQNTLENFVVVTRRTDKNPVFPSKLDQKKTITENDQ